MANGAAHSKLMGAELQRFAAAESGTRKVLIELSRPLPSSSPTHVALGARRWSDDLLAVDGVRDAPSTTRFRMDALAERIGQLVEGQPVRFDVAEAFAVEVTPQTLRKLLELDEVGVIRPSVRMATRN